MRMESNLCWRIHLLAEESSTIRTWGALSMFVSASKLLPTRSSGNTQLGEELLTRFESWLVSTSELFRSTNAGDDLFRLS